MSTRTSPYAGAGGDATTPAAVPPPASSRRPKVEAERVPALSTRPSNGRRTETVSVDRVSPTSTRYATVYVVGTWVIATSPGGASLVHASARRSTPAAAATAPGLTRAPSGTGGPRAPRRRRAPRSSAVAAGARDGPGTDARAP